MPAIVTYSPSSPNPETINFDCYSLVINNQSNCWLYYNSTLMANPGQQCTRQLAHADPSAPSNVELSPKAPDGQPDQNAPAGTCIVKFSELLLPDDPGVIGSNLSIIQNSTVVATAGPLNPGAGITLTPIPLPLGIHTIIVENETSAFDITAHTITYVIRGNQSGVVYGSNLTGLVKGGIQSLPVEPAADSSLSITVNNPIGATGIANVLFLGSPALTWPIAVTVNAITVNVPVIPGGLTWTNSGGTITVGGTAQFITNTPSARGLLVGNPDNATEVLGVNWTGTADLTAPQSGTLRLLAGKYVWISATEQVSVVAATNGHAFFASVPA